MTKLQGLGITIGLTVVIAFLVFVIGWVSFIEKHELGFVFNRASGNIERIERTGYVVYTPIKYAVHRIDLRPYQLSITAMFGISQRVLNAKLVQFNPDGLETFIAWHGRSAGDNLNGLMEIMKCYAFNVEGGRDCPFITILSEIAPGQTQTRVDTSSAR